MDDIVIDNHIAIWYFADASQLSKPAETAIDNAEANGIIFVSAITIIELIYLIEKGKIPQDVLDLRHDVLDDTTTAFRLIEISRELLTKLKTFRARLFPICPTVLFRQPLCILIFRLLPKTIKFRRCKI